MSTEQLIIELDARTAKLDAKLKKVEAGLDGVEGKTKKADAGLKKFANGAKVAGGVALKLAAAATALSAAITAMVISSANGRRELELLAKQAKTSTEDFQALSFATSRYGINAEQIADISKDIADKVGEFSAAGTGAFQDYADVMKLTKDEARDAAKEFEGLSSQEILGAMVSRMEAASVSGDKMTFVLESLGNDASRLIPLFKGNSAELLELKKRFDDVNKSLQITGTQAEALREVSNTFTLMTSSIGNATTAISATLAPVLDDFFNDIIDIVPDATQTIVNFINSFLDAENISSIAGVNKEIADGQERIDELTEKINSKRQRGKELIKADRDIERERLADLKEQLEVLTKQQEKLDDAKRLGGGQIGGEAVEGDSGEVDSGLGTGDEIQAIKDRFKLEETLLAEKLASEILLVGANSDTRFQLEQEFADKMAEIQGKAREEARQAAQTDDEAELEALLNEQQQLEDYLNNKLISEQSYQEKLKEIIGEYAPETLDPSILEEQNQTELDLLNEKLNSQLISYESYFGSLKKLKDKDLKDKDKDKNTELKWSTSSTKKLMDDGNALLANLGDNSKASHKIKQGLSASNAFMNTAEGVTDALAEQNYASAAIIAATGSAQIAAILSSSPDSPGGGTGGAPSQAPEQQESFTPETSNIGVDFRDDNSSTTNVITFDTSTGDQLIDVLSGMLNERMRQGR